MEPPEPTSVVPEKGVTYLLPREVTVYTTQVYTGGKELATEKELAWETYDGLKVKYVRTVSAYLAARKVGVFTFAEGEEVEFYLFRHGKGEWLVRTDEFNSSWQEAN